MDFFNVCTKIPEGKNSDKPVEVYADFVVGRSKDLMVRGRSFYAVWDEQEGLWSTDEYDVQRLVDQELDRQADILENRTGVPHSVRHLRSFGSNS